MMADPIKAPLKETMKPASFRTNARPVREPSNTCVAVLCREVKVAVEEEKKKAGGLKS